MSICCRSFSPGLRLLGSIFVAGIILVSCGPTANQSTAPTSPYERAKDAFKSGDMEKALDLTDKLATTTPPGDFTARAQMLRAVIYTGEMKSAKELADAYGKGAEQSKNPRFKTEYLRLHHDSLENAAKAALNVAETAHQMAPSGEIAKEVILEASFPTTEGPAQVKELSKVEAGGWLEPDQQESAAADSLRKGVDDALAAAVGGDRAKAREAVASGSVNLTGAAAALFLAQQLAVGAAIFDRHNARDPQKLLTLCDEGEQIVKAALAQLKDAPNKDQEKEVKKLQDQFSTLRKDK
jgi:hypothetical protein